MAVVLVSWFHCSRIFNGCEVLIENSVMRATVRHHEARRVMPNSFPESSDGRHYGPFLWAIFIGHFYGPILHTLKLNFTRLAEELFFCPLER